jgi:hypothetical protein
MPAGRSIATVTALAPHLTAGGFDTTVTRSAKVTFDGPSTAVLEVAHHTAC